ncbi:MULTISPECIES: prolipoprotein diacylglyceryl transferase [unclassified Gemella]|uniref:prolipoprotein diacylglyceryl transferase n=1 Tax=unclassified Gemella TaxID=2624949 RepID=UPI001C05D24E|nr:MULTISPECIES: prolipoprotein diacylglyceryl transferase [unclassified Gemella]MBU0278058.1 prolipoprotein diacylglyceryl transferase [Gemella sp. zg-1178]QWQ38413.1 prolipoprotein diacylglyceryl transferase [Gemella sp. zg-570]
MLNIFLNPIAFELFGHPVYWYGIIISLTIFVAYYVAEIEARKLGVIKDKMLDLLLIAIPVAFIFARAYYVIFRWDYYSQNKSEIVAIWDGGIAIYGGLIGGLLVLIYFSKRNNLKLIKLLDIIAPSLLIGQMFGRWGNFFNHEAYGEIVNKEFLQNLHIPEFIINNMYINGNYRQPTFLYESLWCFISFIILFSIRKKLYSGEVFSLYMILYGVERFIVEGMRTDSLYIGLFRVSQIVSIIFIILGITYFIYNRLINKQDKLLYINS